MPDADRADNDPFHEESLPDSELLDDDTDDGPREESSDTVVSFTELQAELHEAQDRALRAQAELENYRKRARRDIEEERRYANLPLIGDLLSVLDNLDRAMESADQLPSSEGLLAGVSMVAKQFRGVLEQYNCQRIPDLGETFDPNLHEAAGQEATDEFAAGAVSRVLRTGYRLQDRVIRPSQVMISAGPPAAQKDPATPPDEPT
jgi:molecular chaperone GrpE